MEHPWYKKRPLSANIPAGMSESTTFSGRTQRPVIDPNICTRCGMCFLYCPEGIIERGAEYTIHYEYCHGCGLCAVECPRHAISMVEED